MDDFSVKIAYRDKDLKNVGEYVYGFRQYAEMLKREQLRIIMDVEDVVYYLQDGKSKDDWDSGAMSRFQYIRHKLLDQANAIERLPQNLYYKDVTCMSVNLSEEIAKVLNAAQDK